MREYPESTLRQTAAAFWNTHEGFAAYRNGCAEADGARRLLNVYGRDPQASVSGCPLRTWDWKEESEDFYVWEGRVVEPGDPSLCGVCRNQLVCALAGGPGESFHFEVAL